MSADKFLSYFPPNKQHIVIGQFNFRTFKGKPKPERVVANVLSDFNRRIFHTSSSEEGQLYADFRKIVNDHRDEAEQYAAEMLERQRGKS